jgi:hypothetical protein
VLTRNLRDFDVMNQILPDGRVLFYERVDHGTGQPIAPA